MVSRTLQGTHKNMKTCRKCDETKIKDMFYPRERVCKKCRIAKQKEYYNADKEAKKKYIKEWARRNPEKRNASMAKRKAANPELFKDYSARHRLRVRYGITLEQYKEMFEEQEGLCFICKQPETAKTTSGTTRRLALDHCHDTGETRKLLCDQCNRGIGAFKDNPKLLREAANYLERAKEPMKV